jgi:hypothetical protein
MCRGGRFLASFYAGADERPKVPDPIGESLTFTADGLWVVWAQKLARLDGDWFKPLAGGHSYPRDATALCRYGRDHTAPGRWCNCGFHALSDPRGLAPLTPFGFGCVRLDVALSGRILAFEWPAGGVLWRAQRQTVLNAVTADPDIDPVAGGRPWAVLAGPPPDDPAGALARRPRTSPRGAGPIRLRLPDDGTATLVAVADDIGLCVADRDALGGDDRVEQMAGTCHT